MTYDFQERLQFSKGSRQETDCSTIMSLLDGCASVSVASEELDRIGVDYIATLRRGAEVYIDAKTRQPGCSKYWKGEPELAIEIWSVMPGGKFNMPLQRAKAGWTLDESKRTDMILYTFDEQDSKIAYLMPFQSLRIAARRNYKLWMSKHKVDIQSSGTWQSMAVFVPSSHVIQALSDTYTSNLNI